MQKIINICKSNKIIIDYSKSFLKNHLKMAPPNSNFILSFCKPMWV